MRLTFARHGCHVQMHTSQLQRLWDALNSFLSRAQCNSRTQGVGKKACTALCGTNGGIHVQAPAEQLSVNRNLSEVHTHGWRAHAAPLLHGREQQGMLKQGARTGLSLNLIPNGGNRREAWVDHSGQPSLGQSGTISCTAGVSAACKPGLRALGLGFRV